MLEDNFNDNNTSTDPLKQITESIISIVDSFIVMYSDKLIKMAINGDRGELINRRHQGNFLSRIDLELHELYAKEMSKILPSFIYASEEGEPRKYPVGSIRSPEYVVIVDPLDTSELAVRGLHGYTQVVVFSIVEQRPVIAVVGDIFHDIRIFCAYRTKDGKDTAFLRTRQGVTLSINSSKETRLNKALITSYLMRPQDRFGRIMEEGPFLEALSEKDSEGEQRGRIGVDFGSIGLCHVAAGFTDAFIEIAKGFSLWDLLPGQYILETAGGIVTTLDGKRLSLNLPLKQIGDVKDAMNGRQKFIATGNVTLLNQLLNTLSRRT
jgi:fructose-1,6-bisphosphatase/inositol monophosphatase family enzyme